MSCFLFGHLIGQQDPSVAERWAQGSPSRAFPPTVTEDVVRLAPLPIQEAVCKD